MILFARLALSSICFFAISCCSYAWAQESATSPSDITVTGTKITADDLKGSKKTASFPKSEIMAFMKTGKPACANGTTAVRFDAGKGFSLAGESLSVEELIKRVIASKNAGKISCIVVEAISYDKPTFDRLDEALVVPQQISLMWNMPDKSK